MKIQAAMNQRGSILVYDEKQTFVTEQIDMQIWQRIIDGFQNEELAQPKVYCYAELSDKNIELKGPTEDQNLGW